MILKTWKKQKGPVTYYIEVKSDFVYIWETLGAPVTEAGASYLYENILDGSVDALILEKFNKKTLEKLKQFLKEQATD